MKRTVRLILAGLPALALWSCAASQLPGTTTAALAADNANAGAGTSGARLGSRHRQLRRFAEPKGPIRQSEAST